MHAYPDFPHVGTLPPLDYLLGVKVITVVRWSILREIDAERASQKQA